MFSKESYLKPDFRALSLAGALMGVSIGENGFNEGGAGTYDDGEGTIVDYGEW